MEQITSGRMAQVHSIATQAFFMLLQAHTLKAASREYDTEIPDPSALAETAYGYAHAFLEEAKAVEALYEILPDEAPLSGPVILYARNHQPGNTPEPPHEEPKEQEEKPTGSVGTDTP